MREFIFALEDSASVELISVVSSKPVGYLNTDYRNINDVTAVLAFFA